MKKTIIKTGVCIATFLSIIMVSCETIEDTYSEFTKDGETIFIGSPVSISNIPSGINQIKLFIELNADPKISKGAILDNNNAVVKEFEVDLSTLNDDNILPVDIEINEGDQTLFVVLKDDLGNESLKKEILVRAYGENYRSGLIPRIINSLALPDKSTAIINWADVSAGIISSVLTYEDSTGALQTLAIENDTNETILSDFKVGGNVFVTSSYKPTEDSTITFSSLEKSYNIPSIFPLDKSIISVTPLAGDSNQGYFNSPLTNLFDGNIETFWHGGGTGSDSEFPFIHTIDLGVSNNVAKFRLDERHNGNQGRSPGEFQIWGINDLTGAETTVRIRNEDGSNLAEWELDAVAKGWTKLLNVTGNTNTTIEVDIPDNGEQYRYVRLVMVSSINGEPWSNWGEYTFWGR